VTVDDLTEVLARQIHAVDRRVIQGGNVYPEERAEIRRAADSARGLRSKLRLGELRASLTPPTGKPQLLLGFDSPAWGPVVLKVYGSARPWEVETQRLWAATGVPTPAIHAAAEDGPTWLVLTWLPGEMISSAETTTEAGVRQVTRDVAATMAAAHRYAGPMPRHARPLAATTLRHLRIVVGALVRHGYAVPGDWERRAERVLATGSISLLHGDLARGNLIRTGDGTLWIIDASGVTGPAEFDAARWCARVAGWSHARSALDAWLATERTLDPGRAHRLLGAELLMQAGSRELVKDERGEPAAGEDPETLAYLDEAARLLDGDDHR
jgi:hypothetical protein